VLVFHKFKMAEIQLTGIKDVDYEDHADEKSALTMDQNGTQKNGDVEVEVEEGRGEWGHKIEFILASIGLAVGLGNVWRFPYLCQKNGGGAFLIPYFIMMVIEGLPLFYIEFALGQRFQRSAIGCFQKIHPALMGIGVSCVVISVLLCIYYVAVISWCFYYLFISFTSNLPFQKSNCPKYDAYVNMTSFCNSHNSSTLDNYNNTCSESAKYQGDCCLKDPQLYYFYRKALDVSPDIEIAGGVNGKLFGCLILSWVVVYACIVKGVKSSGKAVYFTATFPYVVLIILFFVGVTLPGAEIGLKALFTPKWEKLMEPEIWMDAATQMFFTLSLGFGALVSFASYMPRKNNCVRDAYTVVLINCGTSIFAAIVVFSILGHRQLITGNPVDKVGGGPGLAFITFCDAFLQMPVSPLWSSLFFIMLILLGIDSEFGTLEGAIAPFYDMNWIKMKKEFFTALTAVLMMLIGIGLVTKSGFYVFQIFDDHSVSLGLLFIAFFQVVAVSWVYGNDKFGNDIEYMTGKRPYLFWMICWKYISPIAILIIFIANIVKSSSGVAKYKVYVGCAEQYTNFTSLAPGNNEQIAEVAYPGWAQFIIVIFITITMVPIIIYMVIDLVRNPSKWKEGFKNKLTNVVDLHPDPVRMDPSRRRTPEEMEMVIMKEDAANP